MGAILHPGFLYWDGLKYITTGGSSLASGPAGGDLSGTYPNPIVSGLQNHPISNVAPSDGQVLTWISGSSHWTPTTPASGFTAGGDLSGTSTSQTVVGLQGYPISPEAPSDVNNILMWNGSVWQVAPSTNFILGGDLAAKSGFPNEQLVIGINNLPIVGSPFAIVGSNSVLVTNNISGASTYCYWGYIGDLNIATNAAITGTKISSNFGTQDISCNGNLYSESVQINDIGISTGSGVPSLPPLLERNGSIYLRTDGNTSGTQSIYSYQDGTWVPVGAAAAGAAGGDLSGFYPNPTVVAIQKNPVANTLLGSTQDGYVLTWDNTDGYWKAKPAAGTSFTAGGDLSGTNTSQTVIALQGNSVLAQSLTSVDDGYVLTWHNASSQWEALPTGSGSVILSGDVTGNATSNTVIKINGTSVPATPTANQVLVATSGTTATWELLTNSQISATANIAVSKLGPGTAAQLLLNNSTPTPTWTSVSGDISLSNTGVASVTKIQGNTVTSGALVKGDFLIASSTANWAATALMGDVSASAVTPGLTTVIALQTNPVEFQVLTSDEDGYVLTWKNSGPYWYAAQPASGSFSAGGDLSGTSSSQTVESIQGVAISGTPSIGWIIQATSPTAASWQAPPSGSFSAGGDLSGSSTDQTVIALQGNPVESGTLGAGQDGYVLTWVNADTQWRAEPVAGGGGGESGKVIYTSKTITADYAIDFSEYDYYIWCNQTSPINVTLPVPSPGRTINIKDISNNASTNNISILQNASEDIEGSASTFILSTNLGSVTLAADNNSNWWLV